MVNIVRYKGQTGNQAFQYIFARILATELGLYLKAPAIPFYSNSDFVVEGKTVIEPEIMLNDFDEAVTRHPLAEVLRACSGKRINLMGYFQRADYYIPYRQQIFDWLRVSPRKNVIEQIALHYRGGDFPHYHRVDLKFYVDSLKLMPDSVPKVMYTDDPNADVVQALGIPVVNKNAIESFFEIMASRYSIGGFSTYFWWAAFLSESTVAFPEPEVGWFSKQTPERYLRLPHWLPVPIAPMAR